MQLEFVIVWWVLPSSVCESIYRPFKTGEVMQPMFFQKELTTSVKVQNSTLQAKRGVPALLVYRGGMLIGNFIRLSDELGDDFFAADVESFLAEHGMLPEKTLVPSIIRSASGLAQGGESSSDSDFDVD